MRIDPALPPPAGAQAPIPAGAEPFRPFEDFLEGGAPGRAFGFAEFGMFGREEPPQGPAQILPPTEPAPESGDVTMPVGRPDEPVGRLAAESPAAATSAAERRACPIPALATAMAGSRASSAATGPADAASALPPSEPALAGEDFAPTVAAARRVNQPRLPRSDVSLVMIEKDGVVELVAAGPALDPQACALLRRLAKAILARDGLGLVQFHLNGVPLAPDSSVMIGGSHGTRTR
jgi:hypothetical protein